MKKILFVIFLAGLVPAMGDMRPVLAQEKTDVFRRDEPEIIKDVHEGDIIDQKKAAEPEIKIEKPMQEFDKCRFRGYYIIAINLKENVIVIKNRRDDVQNIEIDSNTRYTKSKRKIALADISVDDKVTVYCRYEERQIKVKNQIIIRMQAVADRVNVWKERTRAKVLGSRVIVSIDESSRTIVIKDKEGNQEEIPLEEDTKIKKKKKIIDISDLNVEDRITVYYRKDEYNQDVVSTIRVLKKRPSKKRSRKKGKS